MLFPYTYVPHQMEKMQEFIDFIFYEIWCKAPIGLLFHPDLFQSNPELKEIMSEFGFAAKAATRGKVFYKEVKTIYELVAQLSVQEIDLFKQWYNGNNDIETVCLGNPASPLLRYADIPVIHQTLSEQLASFFKELYSHSLLKIAVLRSKIGKIDDHYKGFIKTNNTGKCPFCGINDLLGEYNSKREAYDHYLPKALYPFNSINFYNLVPACHHCNSSYKTSKNPAFTPKDPVKTPQRRKVFYPYSTVPYAIELQVTLQRSDIKKLTPSDIELQFGPATLDEKINTWKDVYGIEERYKDKLCRGNDGYYWFVQVIDECEGYGKQPADILKMRAEQAHKFPYADCNFLRKPFLDACDKKGVFNVVQKPPKA